jgi:hypothetical protein
MPSPSAMAAYTEGDERPAVVRSPTAVYALGGGSATGRAASKGTEALAKREVRCGVTRASPDGVPS